MNTISCSEKKENEEKLHRDSFDRLNTHESIKFDTKNYNLSDRFNSSAKDFSDKKFSLKTDINESDIHRAKRERQIKSPTAVKSDFDDEMNLNSFSCRTIEENHSTKKILLHDKIDYENCIDKIYQVENNPSMKSSSKHVKAAFKLYSKNENFVSKKYMKNTKNLSYCSNEEEKSITGKKRNSVSGSNSSLNTSSKQYEKCTTIERSKMRSISSASSIKTFQSTNKKFNILEKPSKMQTIKEYGIGAKVPSTLHQNPSKHFDLKELNLEPIMG